jgi:membrane protease subunit (stomatin/prohibitin family)
MGFIRRQLLSVIEWTDSSRDTMVFRFPMEGREIMMGSTLIVREGQVAVFVNNGKLADVFQPGRHHLSTSNLPFITKMLMLPTGFKSTFKSEVYFVTTRQFTNQKWGTANPITMRDKEFGVVRIKAYGKYSFRVGDASVFLRELFGTNCNFTTSEINDYLRSILIAGISDTIAESKVAAIDIACNLLEFNKTTTAQIGKYFENLGLQIVNLIIENVSFPEEIEKAIDMRAKMGLMGSSMDTFMKYQTANAIGDAARNPGAGGNLAGLGVALGTGQVVADAMRSSVQQPSAPAGGGAASKKFCTSCGAEIKTGSRFCNECGTRQGSNDTCSCGTKLAKGAKFCSGCGSKVG